ncbi:hypothetical protein CFC21_090469 [Triticum aestivum]|uniref:Disease resistance protein RPM1 n=2 Tax=Triticum aestivum TaxID=4565 RepID=A0A9R1LEA9_WHEAT|nr:disease resistance protein Pik-2-like [Triticum aestivum]KAF7087273.1 hypothetical protein CFC21_090469 [Triticum aestivum]
MEATALSIGKSVLNGAIWYAKSAIVEEVALQYGVHRNKAFITDELEMMQSFLMVAHDERDEHNKVVRTWVKQVRDVAYDVEDGLQDFVLRVHGKSWWRIPRTFLDRRHVANQMKELRAKVKDVSQRNVRYHLINCASKASDLSITTAAAMFGIDEAGTHATSQHESGSRLDLTQLIVNNKKGLGSDQTGVIGVWGTSGTLGHTSIIWEAYENTNIKLNFPCRAWVRVTHPFNRKEFVESIVEQFRGTSAGVVEFLLEPEAKKTTHELAHEYNGYVSKNRYLIVLTELSTIEEWHRIKTCFPENKLGSRIIVSTEHVEVASLCPGQESIASGLKQLSAEQTIYAFYQQRSQDVTYSWKPTSSSILPCTAENEIQEEQSNDNTDGKMIVQNMPTRINMMPCTFEDFQLIGREKEKSDIIGLIRKHACTQKLQVIALWGMGGIGKTTLIKDVYQRQEVSDMFEKHAFVTVLRPFKLEELLRSLACQFEAKKTGMDFAGDSEKDIALMGVAKLTELLGRRSQGKKCLMILDDLSSVMEWDKLMPSLLAMKNPSLVIVITTRREDIAKHCCQKPEYMQEAECIRSLSGLQDKHACDLFINKVFKNKSTDLAKHYPELVEPAKLILRKCNGLPLAIVTIGGFLADQPTKTAAEWRKLNEHISVELEMNPKLEVIKTVLMKSYDGLPYYLKSCFLYMSIFSEDRNVSRRRLVYRWIAEGYSQDRSGADRYFMELIERSMILPTQQSVYSIQGFDSCQLHDLIRDISIAKSVEENLVFRLEEGCSSNTHGAVRHLAISSNWKGDEREFQSTVELSRIRSLTVYGKYRPFYISNKMRFLRVLDLEDTIGLTDHHLEIIGKLIHLRFLSLRRCLDISYLPDSVGNLRQLETLDIRYTRILVLPKTITKLSKLRYLHAGVSYGVKVPVGIRKVNTLHTLRYVNLLEGNAIMQEIISLTGLRKLGVFGINAKNGPEFCVAISRLSCLESLSVRSEKKDLHDCLHGMSWPPEKLQTLKLRGCLNGLPEWIKGLENLVKLNLELTGLLGDSETMQVIGNLPNLSILRLLDRGIEEPISITFQAGLFRSLVVFYLVCMHVKIESLEFEQTAMPKLEVLSLRLFDSATGISGLGFLPSIREVQLIVEFYSFHIQCTEDITHREAHNEARRREYTVKEDIRKQLTSNKNGPTLKVQHMCRREQEQKQFLLNFVQT